MTNYKSYIKNITTGEWLKEEANGNVQHSNKDNEKLIFLDEEDAESTLEYLNENFNDAYVLLDDSTEISYLDDIEVAGILEGKGYTFYTNGEFEPVKLSEIALSEGYEWEEDKNGWYYAQ